MKFLPRTLSAPALTPRSIEVRHPAFTSPYTAPGITILATQAGASDTPSPAAIQAWFTGQHRKLFDARAEVRMDNAHGPLVAESNAVLYTVPAPAIRKQQKSVEAP